MLAMDFASLAKLCSLLYEEIFAANLRFFEFIFGFTLAEFQLLFSTKQGLGPFL